MVVNRECRLDLTQSLYGLSGLGELLQVEHGACAPGHLWRTGLLCMNQVGGDAFVTPANTVASRQSEVVVNVWYQVTNQEEFMVNIASAVCPINLICK